MVYKWSELQGYIPLTFLKQIHRYVLLTLDQHKIYVHIIQRSAEA